jgi:hypothetical protein
MNVTTKGKVSGRELTVDYNIGEVPGDPAASIKNAIQLFGADTVWANCKSEMLTSVRDKIRPQLEAGVVDADIVASLKDFKIGVRSIRAKDPLEKILKLMGALDEEKKAEVLKLLRGKK